MKRDFDKPNTGTLFEKMGKKYSHSGYIIIKNPCPLCGNSPTIKTQVCAYPRELKSGTLVLDLSLFGFSCEEIENNEEHFAPPPQAKNKKEDEYQSPFGTSSLLKR